MSEFPEGKYVVMVNYYTEGWQPIGANDDLTAAVAVAVEQNSSSDVEILRRITWKAEEVTSE